LITIDEIDRPEVADGLLGAVIEAPQEGARRRQFTLWIRGWAAAVADRVVAVEVGDGLRVILRAGVLSRRPDVVVTHPGAPDECGFNFGVQSLELPHTFELELWAVTKSGARHPLGKIRGRRESLPQNESLQLAPVLITTIGRSGSKWLTTLLGCHPDIVAFEPLVYEPRVATYWLSVFRALSTPYSYLRQIHADNLGERRWWLGDGAGDLPTPPPPGSLDWLGGGGVMRLARMCQGAIDAFYRHTAAANDKPEARYFVEKFTVHPQLLNLATELFPQAREIILVRDLRDWLSSVLSWNALHDQNGFGREEGMSDAVYLQERARMHAEALLARSRERQGAAHVVRYEDLITAPEQTLGDLLGFLGLGAGPAPARLVEDASRDHELMDPHRTVADPQASIGRWRRDLAPELAELATDALGPALRGFGYET